MKKVPGECDSCVNPGSHNCKECGIDLCYKHYHAHYSAEHFGWKITNIDMIDYLLARCKLNEWEENFLRSIKDLTDLSPAQQIKLNEIFDAGREEDHND